MTVGIVKLEPARRFSACYACGTTDDVAAIVVGHATDSGESTHALSMCGACRSMLGEVLRGGVPLGSSTTPAIPVVDVLEQGKIMGAELMQLILGAAARGVSPYHALCFLLGYATRGLSECGEELESVVEQLRACWPGGPVPTRPT